MLQQSEAFADYLEKEHWRPELHVPPTFETPPRAPTAEQEAAGAAPFTTQELLEAISQLKTGKATGPDEVSAEMIKFLEDRHQLSLLQVLNTIWLQQEPPQQFMKAWVVMIHKKGDCTKPSNFRPIALLSVCYKLYAILIKYRVQQATGIGRNKFQYGFTPGRSSAEAIFLLKATLALWEAGQQQGIAILTDWEKAFDKISHCALVATLRHIGVPSHVTRAIDLLYSDPVFSVRTQYGTSHEAIQGSGIRQGCTLSPFLFTLVLDTVFAEVHHTFEDRYFQARPQQLASNEIYFADDTALLAISKHVMQHLLRRTETIARMFGLKINKSKCVMLARCGAPKIRFADNTLVPRRDTALYLGTPISILLKPDKELAARLSTVWATTHQLKLFWNAKDRSTRWKLQVVNAVLRPKAIYGLEGCILNKALLARLDAALYCILRKLFRVPHTHVDRRYTNQWLLDRATQELYPQGDRKFEPWSSTLRTKRLKFLGHIIRAGPGTPTYDAVFADDTLRMWAPAIRRAGRPRLSWVEHTMTEAWYTWTYIFYEHNEPHRLAIKERALMREPPFD
jgi:hypothetical protein